jgi:hypothetical protein
VTPRVVVLSRGARGEYQKQKDDQSHHIEITWTPRSRFGVLFALLPDVRS